MKRFKFKLQTLLDQRQAKEEQLIRELGVIQAQERRERLELEKLENRCLEAFRNLQEKLLGERLDSTAINRLDEYARGSTEDVEAQQVVVDEVRRELLAKQEDVLEAMKERKVLETLKEKQLLEHNIAEMRAEQSTLDEISSLRYARGMQNA